MKRRRRSGFSFIEVTVAIVILGVFAAIAMPKMSGFFRRNRIRGAARDIAATLRYARHAAVLRQDGCEIRFDPVTGGYQVFAVHLGIDGLPAEDEEDDDRGGSRGGAQAEFQLSSEAMRPKTLPKETFFTILHSSAPMTEEGEPRIIFYPDGTATSAWIGVQGTDQSAMAVQVYRTTGLSVVRKGEVVLPPETKPLYAAAESVSYAGYR